MKNSKGQSPQGEAALHVARPVKMFEKTKKRIYVNNNTEKKATNMVMLSFVPPHMRAFHLAWFSFFCAFLSWFAFAPLMPTLRKELNLTADDIGNANITSVVATMFCRVLSGIMIDKYGVRTIFTIVMCGGGIIVALGGVVQNGTDLLIMRLFVGCVGAAFVPCQVWTSKMFAPNIVGTANAFAGGWGNLGGGVTYIFIPIVFDIIKACGADADTAWRITLIVPGVICFTDGVLIKILGIDDPKDWKQTFPTQAERPAQREGSFMFSRAMSRVGSKSFFRKRGKDGAAPDNFNKPKTEEATDANFDQQSDDVKKTIEPELKLEDDEKAAQADNTEESATKAVFCNPTVWLLMLHYACCFGTELAVNNIIGLYFYDGFRQKGCIDPTTITRTQVNTTLPNNTIVTSYKETIVVDDEFCRALTQTTAGQIASLFGLMNLFARAIGGLMSDSLLQKYGLWGRLLAQQLGLLMSGLTMMAFSQINELGYAVFVLIIFSTSIQCSEGTTYAVVPYVSKQHVGKVAGLVGAGGNMGAVAWGFLFKAYKADRGPALLLMGIVVTICSASTWLIKIQGKWSWDLWGMDVVTTSSKQKSLPGPASSNNGASGRMGRQNAKFVSTGNSEEDMQKIKELLLSIGLTPQSVVNALDANNDEPVQNV